MFFRCVQGMVTLANLMSHLTNGKVQASDPVEKVLYRQIRKVTLDTPLSRVSKFLETDHFVLIVHTQKQCKRKIMIPVLFLAFNSTALLIKLFCYRQQCRFCSEPRIYCWNCHTHWFAELHDISWRHCRLGNLFCKPVENLTLSNIVVSFWVFFQETVHVL